MAFSQDVELVNLYHLAQTALDNPNRWERMVWASNAYAKEHALEVTPSQAYKMLERALA